MRLAWAGFALCCGIVAMSLGGRPVLAAGKAPPAAWPVAQFMLVDRLRDDAAARAARAAAAAGIAHARHIDRMRARLRLQDRREAAEREMAARRHELATGLVRLAPMVGRDDRARLLLAGLAHALAGASQRLERLRGEEADAARERRAAAATEALWARRRATALAEEAATGARWRRALVLYATHGSHPGAEPGASSAALLLTGLDPVTVGRGAAPSRTIGVPAARHHKLAMPVDRRLDTRLLRLVASSPLPARRAARPDVHVPSAAPILPVAGRLEGRGSSGIVIITPVRQVVSSPVAGRVMFAQPFRGLGPLLIIDRGGGYHVVMTGMTRLDVPLGASLVAGQAVGVVVAGEDGPARLRVELRYRGLPTDPAPWLAALQDKVRS